MHIIMNTDEMNKIEVRNVEKYPLFAVFYEVFYSIGNHSIFICCANRIKILHLQAIDLSSCRIFKYSMRESLMN